MIIGADFDGTIHDWEHPVPGRRMGPPMEGAKEALQQFKSGRHDIVIYSCNNPEVIRKWMDYWQIPYDYIWDQGKPVCGCYIDDKAVRFTNWRDIAALSQAGKL